MEGKELNGGILLSFYLEGGGETAGYNGCVLAR